MCRGAKMLLGNFYGKIEQMLTLNELCLAPPYVPFAIRRFDFNNECRHVI
jgi:hypothetical protein